MNDTIKAIERIRKRQKKRSSQDWTNADDFESARKDMESLLRIVTTLESKLATAQSMCRTAHDVARAAWGGEIPSPLPGHRHMTEEEMLADAERCNCPWCGGSGHVDDCDEADRLVKAKLAKAEADKAVLVKALESFFAEASTLDECSLMGIADILSEGTLSKMRAALSGVKGEA